MTDAARPLGITDDVVVAVLRAPVGDARLADVVTLLYDRWDAFAVASHLSLVPGARDAAFAVTLEQLARETRRIKKPLEAGDLRSRELEVVRTCLQRRAGTEIQRPDRPYDKWLPDPKGELGSKSALLGALARVSQAPDDPIASAALAPFMECLRRRAVETFGDVREDERTHALDRAVTRLTQPLTAAGLTIDSLGRRVRDVAVQELTKVSRAGKVTELHPSELDEDLVEPGLGPGELREMAWRMHALKVMRDAVVRFLPWTRDWFKETRNAKQIGEGNGKSHAAVRKHQQRIRDFLRSNRDDLEAGDYTRDDLDRLRERVEENQRRSRVSQRLAQEVWAALQEAFDKGLLTLPAVLWDRLRAWFRGGPGQSPPDDGRS